MMVSNISIWKSLTSYQRRNIIELNSTGNCVKSFQCEIVNVQHWINTITNVINCKLSSSSGLSVTDNKFSDIWTEE